MKNSTLIIGGIVAALLVALALGYFGGSQKRQLMNDAYSFDGSTYDYVETKIETDSSKHVEFTQGGRLCNEVWQYNNGKLVAKKFKQCENL